MDYFTTARQRTIFFLVYSREKLLSGNRPLVDRPLVDHFSTFFAIVYKHRLN